MKDLLHGNLGLSVKQRGRTVNMIIASKVPVSAKSRRHRNFNGQFWWAFHWGVLPPLNEGRSVDDIIIVFSTCGIAIPSFVICTILMYVLSLKLGLLPTYGLASWKNYIMPVIALALYPSSYIARLMRSSMLDVMGQDYMRTARAKGLSQVISIFKHALRNAILPVVTYLGPLLAYTVTEALSLRRSSRFRSLGSEFIGSITGRDYPLIMGTTIFLASLMVVMNVIVDVAYKLIDPRINLK